MSDRLREAFAGAVKRIEERQWIYGLLGRKNSDGTFTFNVPGRRGFLFVTIRNAAGAQTVIPARNDFGVEHRLNLGVRMKLEHGIYVIWGKANRSDLVHTPASPDYGIPDHPISSHNDIPPYATNAGKLLAVKATEDGVEWVLVGADVATQTSAADTEDTIDDASLWGRVEGGVWVKTAWSNIKAVLKTYFDTLYTAINTAVLLTGNQTVAGIKRFVDNMALGGDFAPAYLLDARRSQNNANTRINAQNDNAGTAAQALFQASNGTGTFQAGVMGTGFTPSGLNQPNWAFFQANAAAGLLIRAIGAGVPIILATNNIERVRIDGDGNVGIGVNPTLGKLQVAGDIVLRLNDFVRVIDSGGTARSVFGSESADNSVSFFNNFDGDGGPIRIRPLAAGGESARFDENGRFGIGVTSPQGPLHVHNGTGGKLFVTKTGINATAQTIIPDGSGDVLRRCVITYVLWATDNTMSGGATITIANNASFQVFVDVGNNNGVTFAVASNGTLTVQRTTGTKTFTLAAHVVWL